MKKIIFAIVVLLAGAMLVTGCHVPHDGEISCVWQR